MNFRLILSALLLWPPLLSAQNEQQIPPFRTTYGNFTQGTKINGSWGQSGWCKVSTGNGEAWQVCPSTVVGSYPGVSSDLANGLTVTGCPILSSPTQVCVKAAPYYAAGFLELDAVTAGVSSGSTTVPVANGAQFAINQQISVALAGSGGSHYVGTITGISGNNLAVTPAMAATIVAGTEVWGFGTTTTVGTTGVGTSLTLATAASYAVNQGILISGAGTSGANYIGKITAIAGNVLTLSPSTSTSVSSGTVVQHDDSAAIQAAVTAVAAIGSGTVILPNGYYQLNGPFQDVSGANAVITVPKLQYFSTSLTTGGWTPMASIRLAGVTPPGFSENYLSATGTQPPFAGAILATQLTGGNLIGGFDSASLNNFTNVLLTMDNIGFRAPPNPAITMINGQAIAGLDASNINCDTLTATVPVQPTSTNGRCIVFPGGANSSFSRGTDLNAIGYYTAYTFTEHTIFDRISAFANWQALEHIGTGYGSFITSIQSQGNTYGLVTDGVPAHVAIARFQIEHATTAAWMTSVADIYDPTNSLSGSAAMDGSPYNIVGAAGMAITDATNFPIYPNATSWDFGLVGYGYLFNLETFASQFDNAAWTKTTGVSISTAATTAPDQTVTGEKQHEGTSTNASNDLYQPMTLGSATVTCSVYAKPAERAFIFLRLDQGIPHGAVFSLSGPLGAVSIVDSGYTAAIIGFNGWYRVSVTTTVTAGTWYEDIAPRPIAQEAGYTGDGSSGIYIWGAQCAVGNSPGPLVPTTSVAVQRIGFTAPNISF